MPTIFKSCIAKRTRLQQQLLLSQEICGSSRVQSGKRNRGIGFSKSGYEQGFDQVIDVDDYGTKKKKASKTVDGNGGSSRLGRRLDQPIRIDDSGEEQDNENGSGCSSRSKVRLKKSIELDESSPDESEEEESDAEESDGLEEVADIEFPKITTGSNGYGSARSFKTGTHTYFVYSSDDSDSDDTIVVLDEEEDADEDFPRFCKEYDRKQNDMNACFYDQSTEDEPSSSSESESDNSENWDFLLNKRLNHPTSNTDTSLHQSTEHNEPSTSIQSESENSHGSEFLASIEKPNQQPTKNMEEKVLPGSANGKENNHSVRKAIAKKMDKKPTDCSSDTDTNGKTSAKHIANGVKHRECKGRRVPREENGGSVDAILDSIVGNGDVHGKEDDDDGDRRLPLRFRFDDSEDESVSRETHDSDVQRLFQEMNFELECEEIGSYKNPTVENGNKDDSNGADIKPTPSEPCQRGEHKDIYLEEETGMRCRLCGAVILESRYVIPKLATYAPDRSKRSYLSSEQQFCSSEKNLYHEASDWNLCEKTGGTFWELIPTRIRDHLYPHQQEGLEFLWENLAGTIKVSSLQKPDPQKGGGCIISHAPGTGKTLLTIVFVESFVKKFPKCCPVIVAPASMLLTWEAEFKKWRMGVPFINLNSSDLSSNEIVNGDVKHKKYLIRAMKISSWSNGGSVLGVSYNLFEKLAGNTNNPSLEKMGNILLDVPGLVVLDEGHTPRNQRSNIWNVLLKLKTKNRVILSGTPFQNNFRELFNTLRLVRPTTATGIMNEKSFADMIQPKSAKKSRGCQSGSEDIERLKTIISPFVHVHKGHILESKLPGLKQSVVLLNPPPFQKCFIENLENLSNTFEYEHKVALVSVHPSLLLQCSLSEKEVKLTDKKELEKVRLRPDLGVKTRFVMELIRLSISLDEKVLIFSQYIQPLELLKDQIALTFGWDDRREIMMIEGKIHQKRRQTIINGFNDPKSKIKVLLASTKCCSEGIHLTGASRVVLLDVVWNPSVERQAISRAYRLGQKKMVYTYHLMTAGTTEEEKYDRQVAKGRLAELVFSSSAMAGDRRGGGGMEVNDKILKEMVNHQELKDMFKKIRYPERET